MLSWMGLGKIWFYLDIALKRKFIAYDKIEMTSSVCMWQNGNDMNHDQEEWMAVAAMFATQLLVKFAKYELFIVP